MSRFRLPMGFCLAVLAISLVFVGVQDTAPSAVAAAPQPNARAVARVMEVQDRHTGRLMAIPGVVGTATGLNAAGQPVVKVFLAKGGVPGIPAKLEGVAVVVKVTGAFVALAPPATPPGQDKKNQAPVVTIVSPEDGSTHDSGVAISFEATATDNEDGDLTARLTWASSRDGDLEGTGGGFLETLSDGTHRITASVTDDDGKTGSDFVTIIVGTPARWYVRPVPIGVSTGHPDITAGTIGCRVKDVAGNVYALSNNHIYADCNEATIDDNVLQPGTVDGGVDPDHAIGTLAAFEPIAFGPRRTNTIDAAIALSSEAKLGNATPPEDGYTPASTVVAPDFEQAVKKHGRTTGLTTGVVSDINATVRVTYAPGWALFENQIIVTPGTFSAGGDSGSLVVTQDGNNPVGLLFAGSSSHTVCNPIGAVLTQLGNLVESELHIDGE